MTNQTYDHSDLISSILSKLILVQKRYGISYDDIKEMRPLYASVLKEYTPESVKKAFFTYIGEHSDIPAPADIKKIIQGANPATLNIQLLPWQEKLSAKISQAAVYSWFRDVVFSENEMTMTAPTEFVATWIFDNYNAALKEIFGDVKITVDRKE